MSVDSFVTAVSDITNINNDRFTTGTKGRFEVVHIEETDEGILIKFRDYFTRLDFSLLDCRNTTTN